VLLLIGCICAVHKNPAVLLGYLFERYRFANSYLPAESFD
jgi:hypothetical protein